MDTNKLAENIRRIMRDRNMPIKALAPMVGWNRTTLGDHLNNPEVLSLWELERIAEALGVPVAELFKGVL